MASHQRISVALLAWIIAASSGTLHAQEPPTLQQLADSARKLSDLTALRPYVLRASVIANRGDKEKEQTGQLTIYRDRDRARLELSLGASRETRVVLGDRQYISLEAALFTATGLTKFDSAWLQWVRVPTDFSPLVAKTKVGSEDAWCSDLEEKSGSRRLCYDAERPVLLSVATTHETNEFFDYTLAGERWFPGRAVMSRQDLTPVELTDIQVVPGSLDPTLFDVPAGSMEIETCSNLQPAKPTRRFNPQFPESESKLKNQGAVSLSIILDKEGKLAAARVLNATNEAFAHQSLVTIEQWKFQPGICASHPVNQEMTVSFTFNLY
jgi:TonB family protein